MVAPALWIGSLVYTRLQRRRQRWELAGLAAAALLPAVVWTPSGALAALLTLAVLLAAGQLVVATIGPAALDPVEELLLAAGAGLGALIAALFLLGLAGALHPWSVAAGSLTVLAFASRRLGACCAKAGRALGDAWIARSTAPSGIAVFFAAVFLAPATMVALAPALAHDALAMHLPAARHYAESSALQPLPFLDYSYFPQGFELLLAAQWPLGGQAGAQLISPLLFGLTLGALALLGRAMGMTSASLTVGLGAVFALPFLHWTGNVVKNDLTLALTQALGLYCLVRSRGRPQEARWLRLGVLLVASGFAVKYTATFTAAPLGLLYAWRLRMLHRPLREALLWSLVFAAFALYWPARAWALTGNPVFPIEVSWAVESLRPNEVRPEETRSIPYWKVPWTIHFDGENAFESPSRNPAGFFLLLFLPGWLLRRRAEGRPARRAALLLVALFFLYWGSVWPVVRYAIVPLGLLTLMTAHGLVLWRDAVRPWARWALDGALSSSFVFCLLPTLLMSVNGPQLALFAGKIGEDEYLRRTLITYPALEYLQQNAGPDDWILSIGANSGAYAPDPARIRYEYLADAGYGLPLVPRYLSLARYDWLILPAEPWAEAQQVLPAEWKCDERFRDSALTVCLLEGPAGLPPPGN